VPAEQELQEPDPAPEILPFAQSVQPVAPVFTPLLEYLPAPHVAQLLDSLFPADEMYFPLAQPTQLLFQLSLYLPAAQSLPPES